MFLLILFCGIAFVPTSGGYRQDTQSPVPFSRPASTFAVQGSEQQLDAEMAFAFF